MVSHSAYCQFEGEFCKNKRSHQYQIAKVAPAPIRAVLIQYFKLEIPQSKTMAMKNQNPALKAMYNGPGIDANSIRVFHHKMAVTNRKPLHTVRLNTNHTSMVTLKGRFIKADQPVCAGWKTSPGQESSLFRGSRLGIAPAG